MKFISLKYRLLIGGLFYKKFRLFLSLLGIIIGVSSLFIMNSFGESAKVKTLEQIETFGPDVFMVISGSARVRGGRAIQTEQTTTLKVEDAYSLRNIPGVKGLSPMFTGQAVARGKGTNLFTMINGVNEEYLNLRKFSLAEGRNFSREEVHTLSKVAILGYKVKQQIFGSSSAVGERIFISKLPFQVIGVLNPIGVDASNQDQDDQILIPYTTAMSALFNVDYLTAIFIKGSFLEVLPYVISQVEETLLRRHKIDPKRKDFAILKAEDIIKAKEETTQTFSTLVKSVSLLCLVVGSLGVSGIMILAVNERKREIGLRLAIGARKREIFFQFLAESLLITLLGGLIGLFLGLGLIFVLLPHFGYPLILPFKPILISSFFTVLSGLMAGVYPALMAMRIEPAILLKRG